MSSSTSSSDPWKRFFFHFLAASVLGMLGVFAFIVVADPWDSLHLSPAMDRRPITANMRLGFPALARNPKFDSVVIGSSTSRMLRPARLREVFGGTWANLAMNSAKAYEQYELLSLFIRHHPHIRTVIMGFDKQWCQEPEIHTRFTEAYPWPAYLFDEDPWNDYAHLFNWYVLKRAIRQLGVQLGTYTPKWQADGYHDFLPDRSQFDLEKVRRTQWGDGPRVIEPVDPPVVLTEAERRALAFPPHALLEELLAALPEETLKLLVFPPVHVTAQARPGSQLAARWTECKQRIARIAREVPNTKVIDFRFSSPVTNEDGNFWDKRHYSAELAELLVEWIHRATTSGKDAEAYRVLVP